VLKVFFITVCLRKLKSVYAILPCTENKHCVILIYVRNKLRDMKERERAWSFLFILSFVTSNLPKKVTTSYQSGFQTESWWPWMIDQEDLLLCQKLSIFLPVATGIPHWILRTSGEFPVFQYLILLEKLHHQNDHRPACLVLPGRHKDPCRLANFQTFSVSKKRQQRKSFRVQLIVFPFGREKLEGMICMLVLFCHFRNSWVSLSRPKTAATTFRLCCHFLFGSG